MKYVVAAQLRRKAVDPLERLLGPRDLAQCDRAVQPDDGGRIPSVGHFSRAISSASCTISSADAKFSENADDGARQ
jgi:hypothetical protein